MTKDEKEQFDAMIVEVGNAYTRMSAIATDRENYRAALRKIAEADPIDLALDPGWAQMIARGALGPPYPPLDRNGDVA